MSISDEGVLWQAHLSKPIASSTKTLKEVSTEGELHWIVCSSGDSVQGKWYQLCHGQLFVVERTKSARPMARNLKSALKLYEPISETRSC